MPTPTTSVISPNFKRKYTVTLAQLQALGAVTSGNIYIDTVGNSAVIGPVFLKHSTALAGPSLSAATARVTTTNNNYGGAALDVFQAVSATASTLDSTPKKESYAVPTDVNVAIVLTGCNASALTAGSIDVYFDTEIFA